MTHSTHFFIRVFVSVTSKNEAEEVGAKLINMMSTFGKAAVLEIRPYWKISEYYECSFELYSQDLTKAALLAATEKLGTGWESVGSACFVWNRADGKYFIDDRVNWAEVEFIDA